MSDDFSADASTTGVLPENGSLRGRLDQAYDVDWIRVHLERGVAYELTLSSAAGTIYGFDLVDSAGSATTLHFLRPDNGVRTLESTVTGDYFLKISDPFLVLADYTLTSVAYHNDTAAPDISTSATLQSGIVARAAIDFNYDEDWYRVQLKAGEEYTFALNGSINNGGSLGFPILDLYDSKGLQVAEGSGRDPVMVYRPLSDGTYYVSASGPTPGSPGGVVTGSYSLIMGDTHTAMPDIVPPKFNSGYKLEPNGELRCVFNFSETVSLGSGQVILRQQSGEALEVFNIGSSPEVSVDLAALIVKPTKTHPGTTYTIEIPAGAVKDAAGNANIAPVSYQFKTIDTPRNETGGDGNDFFHDGSNTDKFNGGGGVDTVEYDFPISSYLIYHDAYKTTLRNWNTTVTDTLTSIERLQFKDAGLAFDIDGKAGQVYRLYKAAFDRTPDLPGLGYWIKMTDAGISVRDVAHTFTVSDEFKTLYGAAPSDAAFVTALYHNTLHREPDADGANYWLDAMHKGLQREDVLLSFSESPENQSAVLPLIGQGIHFAPFLG